MTLASFLLLALLQMVVPARPNAPAPVNAPDYPLHVRIFGVHWNQNRWALNGWGRGSLLDPTPQEFDYTFTCNPPFVHTRGTETYAARWKKPGRKLEILTARPGSNKFDKCELDVSLSPASPSPAPAPAAVPGAAPGQTGR